VRKRLDIKAARAFITIGTVSFLFGCLPAHALDPSLEVSQYAHTSWKIREGFAPGVIHQIVQTPDGYLWLASDFGLLRFDGVRTVPWQPPPGERLPSIDIRGLIVARDGTFWVGTAKGLVSLKNGKVVHYPELDGHDVYALLEDHEGTVWAGGVVWEGAYTQPGKLCAIRAGTAECYESFGFGVTAIHEDKRGNLWLGAGNGLWRWRPGPTKKYELPLAMHGIPSYVFGLNAMVDEEPDGLIVGAANGITHFVSGKLEPFSFLSWEEQRQPTLLRDRDGALWIGNLNVGLVHLHQGKVDVFTQADGLSGVPIQSMFEDREGSIWVATAKGLDRFREYAVPTISKKQGLSNSNTTCLIAARDGSVWLGMTDALNRWDEGRITVYRKPGGALEAGAAGAGGRSGEETRGRSESGRLGPTVHEVSAHGLPDRMINSLYQDGQGRIWIATSSGLAYFEDGRFRHVTSAPLVDLNAMVGDSAGNLWIAQSERGLARLRDGRLVEQIPWEKLGIRGALSNPLAADPASAGVWVGSWSGGVIRYWDGQVRAAFGAKEGLGTGRVNALRTDRENAIWAATDGGLSRIKDGHVATMTSSNGLPCDTVHELIEDDAGALWIRTACGLVRIEKAELGAWVENPTRRLQVTVFDSSDGVQSEAGAFAPIPRAAKTPDGRLWFLMGDGVSIVDPRHLASNKLPPPVHIEQITADGKVYDAARSLHLPPRIRDLTIDYNALSFVVPEKVLFRYKLEGQDEDWREVINDRQVHYSNLAPKHYRFRVLACNNSGVWNETGDTLEFVIPPAWYQTYWFRALCVAAFLALLWAAYQWRLRQVRHQFEVALDARVGERTRIARELHDTLLQSFHGVLLRFQTAFQLLPDRPVEAREKLGSAIDQAADAITEGRDAVQGLRDSTQQANDLARAISTLGEELATESINERHTRFLEAVEGQSRDLHPILRDEVYKIAAEALRNAFRHAQARQIEVEIHYDDEQFRLRVRDDGKGMNPEVLAAQSKEGHYGLPGMRERATIMGAKLTVWSEVDAGTEVELRLPANIAYPTGRRGSWLSRQFSRSAKA
jgi:signal transduction histidine kinase/ligand-binding sensor domain-containing protein